MKDKNINIGIYDCAGFNRNFLSFKEFMNFCKDEAEFWKAESERNNTQSKRSHNCFSADSSFSQILNSIENWKDSIESWNDDVLTSNLYSLVSSHMSFLRSHWIWSAHGFTKQFLNVLEVHGVVSADAFFSLVVQKSVKSINNFENLVGVVSGYEYVNQDSDITRRSKSEKESINQLRNRFSKAQEKLFSEIAESQKAFSSWELENREKAENTIKIHKEAGEAQIFDQDKSFEEKLREWNTSVSVLQQTYEDKLRLDKPAQYWNKAARRYGRQGWAWVAAIILLVVVALVNFQDFFVHWLSGKELDFKLTSFQGVILFGSIVATYAFVLRIFSRLAFSSFHLMRDAQEREQLTYLYLSLTNEAAIDKESRDIVLQALFARSETGLLTHENGPAMPGIDLSKIGSGKAN